MSLDSVNIPIRGFGTAQLIPTWGYGQDLIEIVPEYITDPVGIYIRNILRNDSKFLEILDLINSNIPMKGFGVGQLISTWGYSRNDINRNGKDFIFLTRPLDQHRGFANPRVVVMPIPSEPNEIANTNIYRGTELYKIHIWAKDIPFQLVIDALDRIVTLFNKEPYFFYNNDGRVVNFGEFICTGKVSFKDIDKENTIKGELNIVLNIGGI